MTQQSTKPREIFHFTSSAIKAETCKVVRFSGTEGLSTLYSFEITLACQEFIDTRKFLISPCTLRIERSAGQSVNFHGFPASCSQNSHHNGWTFYTITLVPQFSKLNGIVHNAIFLNKNVQEIVQEVLKHCGTIKPQHTFQLLKSYPKQEFSMQYNEDAYAYINYFLEREGIYYYFDQQSAQEKIIFCDAPTTHLPIMGNAHITYSPVSGLESIYTDEVITSFTTVQSPLPKYVHVRDYDWKNPNFTLEAKATVDEHGLGDLFFYGDGFTTTKEGERLAKIRAQALYCKGTVYHGTSSVPRISPGYIFNLEKHFDPSCNASYSITHVHHEGSQEGYISMVLGINIANPTDAVYYRNSFTCIEKNTVFRAPHKTERKKISGMIHAFIDTAGQSKTPEIDDYGRYKVVFPQDISGRGTGKASCWLRRAQPSVGLGYGTSFPLDAGVEVLISFTEGHPDRPFIASAIANRESAARDNSASALFSGLSTAGGSGLTFNDKAEKQGFNLQSGSLRSGLFMASGSLDSSIMQSDSLNTVSSTTNFTHASIANTIASRVKSSMSVTGNPGAFSIINMVLKELTNISTAGATNAKLRATQAETDNPEDTSADKEKMGWDFTTDILKVLSFFSATTEKMLGVTKSHLGTNPSPYISTLSSGDNGASLTLQSKITRKLRTMLIAEAVLSLTARSYTEATAIMATQQDQKDIEKAEADARAQNELDKETAQNEITQKYDTLKTEEKEKLDAGSIDQEQYDAKIAEYTVQEENEKATCAQNMDTELEEELHLQAMQKKQTMTRNNTTALTALLSEVVAFITVFASSGGIKTATTNFGGVKIKSDDSNVALTSETGTHVSSNKNISIVALPGASKNVSNATADDLVKMHAQSMGITGNEAFIFNETDNVRVLAHETGAFFAGQSLALESDSNITISNNLKASTYKAGTKSSLAALNIVPDSVTDVTSNIVAVPAAPVPPRATYSELVFNDASCTLTNKGDELLIQQEATPNTGTLKILRKENTAIKNSLELTNTSSKLTFDAHALEITDAQAKISHDTKIGIESTKEIQMTGKTDITIAATKNLTLTGKESLTASGNWGKITASRTSFALSSKMITFN